MDKNKHYSPSIAVLDSDTANGCWKRCTMEMVNLITNSAAPSLTKEHNNLLLENKDLKKQYKMAIAALDSILSQKDIDTIKVPEHWIRKDNTLDDDRYKKKFAKLQDIASWKLNENGISGKEKTPIIKVTDSSCIKSGNVATVPVKLRDVATTSVDEVSLEKETQILKISDSKCDIPPNKSKIEAKSHISSANENTKTIIIPHFNCKKSPNIAKLQAKLQDIAFGDGAEDSVFEVESTRTTKSSGNNCVKSPNIVKIQEKLQDLVPTDAGEDNAQEKQKTEIITSDSSSVKFLKSSPATVQEGKILFQKINCESTDFQVNKHCSTNKNKIKINVESSICLPKERDSGNTAYLKNCTQTSQEMICSNCEKLKTDKPSTKKNKNFQINKVDETTGMLVTKEDYCKIKKELDHVNEQNINLRTDLCNKTAENEGLRDRVQSLEFSLKTLTEAINLQDDQLSEYGSVVTSLKNSRSIAIEKMMEANQRNAYNIMIIKNIEKEVEQLRRQLDAYNELLINQNTELIDKASSTDQLQVDQNSYTETLKKKDNYIKLLQDRLCEAIVGLKNKDSEIKNHSNSIKSLISDYEREKKCLEERLKFANVSADRMEINKIKLQETMKQLMKLIEFLQQKLEKIDKK